jgi:hypothetical protein
MIVCTRCGKENQKHYKFCLGCGAELSSAPPPSGGAEPVGMMKTMMADVSGAKTVGPDGAGGYGARTVSPAGPPPGVATPPGAPAPGYGAAPAPVPAWVPSSPTGPAGAPPVARPAEAVMTGGRRCTQCGSDVPPNFKFCGACGTPMAAGPAPAAAPARAPSASHHASMTLIRPDGSEGGTFVLQQGENKLGRSHGAIFENDGYLSPTHASITVHGTEAVVADLDSLNGVFVRMEGEELITPGQIVRMGQELLRFDLLEAPAPLEDGTEVMGSPNPGYWGKITVVIGSGVDGSAYPLLADSISLGRERGDINFPDDGYVSGLHARMSTRGGKVYLVDLGSSNGTFVKIQGSRKLGNQSYVLLGQQLFRMLLT